MNHAAWTLLALLLTTNALWRLSDHGPPPFGERWRLNMSAAFGTEIIVKTDGEDVGAGAIGILGLSLRYTF